MEASMGSWHVLYMTESLFIRILTLWVGWRGRDAYAGWEAVQRSGVPRTWSAFQLRASTVAGALFPERGIFPRVVS